MVHQLFGLTNKQKKHDLWRKIFGSSAPVNENCKDAFYDLLILE